MIIYHLADLHLGSKSLGKVNKYQKDIKATIHNGLEDVCKKAEEENVSAILLAGDLFDDKTEPNDREFFYDLVKGHSTLTFYYLKGNHDEMGNIKTLENLKTFTSEEWTSYVLDDVTISGREMTDVNYSTIYNDLDLNKDKFNIVMMHGAVNNTQKALDTVCLNELKNKFVNYLALGHIHKPMEKPEKLDARGVYAMAGCFFGRSFDEAGKHGYYALTIEDGKLQNAEFRTIGDFAIYDEDIDLSNVEMRGQVLNEVVKNLTNKNITEKDILRITLTGEVNFPYDSLEDDISDRLKGKYPKLISIKNSLHKKINMDDPDITDICKEFILLALDDKLDDKDLTDKQRKEINKAIVDIGLHYLNEEGK